MTGKDLELWAGLVLAVLAAGPGLMIAALLFLKVEQLGCLQRIGLGLIGAAMMLSHPAFPIAFRVLLFAGLGLYLAACYGPALKRRVVAELDDRLEEALRGAEWDPPKRG